jgi:uncharacterized membrane protein
MFSLTLLAESTSGAGYKAFMTIHVLAAIVWLGGGFLITAQAERAKRAKNDEDLVAVAISADYWATHLFIPTALVLLVCGFGMIGTGHLGFSHPFIDIGLVGWAVSFAIGAGFLGPQSGQVKNLAAASNGSVTPEIVTRVDRILVVARIDMVILLAIAAIMVIQPGGGV